MRRALVVGIDDYPQAPLRGCVNDARRVADLLAKHQDGSPNFECQVLAVAPATVTKGLLRQKIGALFANDADLALFYFSGHGTVNNLGGYLVTPDATRNDEGVSMQDVLTFANNSRVREAVVVLDCCHSGAFGQLPALGNQNTTAALREGVSVLTATREYQSAVEVRGAGVFTSLLCAALEGGASDVLGKVTLASAYAYVDEALGAWEQRPLFKAHVARLSPLRECRPVVSIELLRLLPQYFKDPGAEFKLDPSYEPDASPRHPENERVFGHLQRFRAARLLEPVGEEHMYFAAMNSKSCRLTPLGLHYWRLANAGKI